MKKLLFAMAIGAALAWLFDPDAGSRRRDSLRQAGREGPDRVEPAAPASRGATSYGDPTYDETSTGDAVPPPWHPSQESSRAQ